MVKAVQTISFGKKQFLTVSGKNWKILQMKLVEWIGKFFFCYFFRVFKFTGNKIQLLPHLLIIVGLFKIRCQKRLYLFQFSQSFFKLPGPKVNIGDKPTEFNQKRIALFHS